VASSKAAAGRSVFGLLLYTTPFIIDFKPERLHWQIATTG
jgi:hypothetical protein